PVAPLDTAAATADCSAVSCRASSATGAPAYVRPSRSRTAAPLAASARPIAPRASTTNLASSASSSVIALPPSGFRRTDQDRTDPDTAAVVGPAFGAQPQPIPRDLGAGQRDAAQFEGDQPTDRVDVEVLVELHVVQLAEILDRQPGRHPKVLVAQVFHRCDLVGVVLVGDLADDLLQHILDCDQARDGSVLVDQQRHVVAVPLHLTEQRVERL